jgi:hypothetical protein
MLSCLPEMMSRSFFSRSVPSANGVMLKQLP